LKSIPNTETVIIEAGTPLIKKYGLRIIRDIRKVARETFVVADLKTLDAGRLEARLAYEESADGAVVSGLAPKDTIETFLQEAGSLGMWGIVDMLAVNSPLKVLMSTDTKPGIVVLHRGIDEEHRRRTDLAMIKTLKRNCSGLLVAVAGGVDPVIGKRALENRADILVVGRYVTGSADPRKAIFEFLSLTRER